MLLFCYWLPLAWAVEESGVGVGGRSGTPHSAVLLYWCCFHRYRCAVACGHLLVSNAQSAAVSTVGPPFDGEWPGDFELDLISAPLHASPFLVSDFAFASRCSIAQVNAGLNIDFPVADIFPPFPFF